MNNLSVLLVGPFTENVGGYNKGGVAQYSSNLFLESKKFNNFNYSLLHLGKSFKINSLIPRNGFILFSLVRYGISLNLNVLLKNIFICFKFIFLDLKKFDIVHIQGIDNAPYFLCNYLRSNRGLKVILTVHSYHNIAPHKKNFNKVIACCENVIHVSNHDKRKGENHGFNFRKNDIVLYNFLKITYPISENIFSKKSKSCFIGSDIPRKQLNLAIKISNELNMILSIYGVNSTKHKGSYKCFGYLQNEILMEKISSYKLLINPSKSESFGLVYIEAILRGLIVIGYTPILEEFGELGISRNSMIFKKSHNKNINQICEEVQLKLKSYDYNEYVYNFDILKENFSFENHYKKLYDLYSSKI